MIRGEQHRSVEIDDDGNFVVFFHGMSFEGNEMKYHYTVDSRLVSPEDTHELERLCEQTEELHRRAQRLAADVTDPDRNEKLDAVLDQLSVSRDRMSDLLEVISIATADKEPPS